MSSQQLELMELDPYIAYIEESILAYKGEICSFRLRFTRGLSLKRERSCALQLDQRLEASTLVVKGCFNEILKGSERFGVLIFRFSAMSCRVENRGSYSIFNIFLNFKSFSCEKTLLRTNFRKSKSVLA